MINTVKAISDIRDSVVSVLRGTYVEACKTEKGKD
jgi:hypothetical protein